MTSTLESVELDVDLESVINCDTERCPREATVLLHNMFCGCLWTFCKPCRKALRDHVELTGPLLVELLGGKRAEWKCKRCGAQFSAERFEQIFREVLL